MTINNMRLVPRSGRDRIDHAQKIADILENNTFGLTINECIAQLFGGSLPSDQNRLLYEQEEFKRSYEFISDLPPSKLGGFWGIVKTFLIA